MIIPEALDALAPVQVALYQRLAGDGELLALLGDEDRVYDDVPEDARFPYVTIGESLESPDNHHGGYGSDISATLHVWSRYAGFTEANTIAARIRRLLDHQPLQVTGQKVIAVRWEFAQALRDPDPAIRHVQIRFEIITEQE